jgi:hypothetical protein
LPPQQEQFFYYQPRGVFCFFAVEAQVSEGGFQQG